MQQRSEERPGGALKHDRFFGPWPCASTRPMAWPNRLSLCESSIFFVSFATFCPNSERYRARETRRGSAGSSAEQQGITTAVSTT